MNTNKIYSYMELLDQLAYKQVIIDNLMFEYCPNEMTETQVAEWGRRQRPVSKEREEEINKVLGISK